MTKSIMKAVFKCDMKTVWDVVTDVKKYSSWRSDVSKTQLPDDKHFIEYTKEGYATTFTITDTKLHERWEFDMDNSNMTGHWIGIFTAKDGVTEVEFIEEVEVKKILMKPFVKGYLKKQQAVFVNDLRKIVEG